MCVSKRRQSFTRKKEKKKHTHKKHPSFSPARPLCKNVYCCIHCCFYHKVDACMCFVSHWSDNKTSRKEVTERFFFLKRFQLLFFVVFFFQKRVFFFFFLLELKERLNLSPSPSFSSSSPRPSPFPSNPSFPSTPLLQHLLPTSPLSQSCFSFPPWDEFTFCAWCTCNQLAAVWTTPTAATANSRSSGSSSSSSSNTVALIATNHSH